MNWSIPDVLRINDFTIEVKLTVQQFYNQEMNRPYSTEIQKR